MILSVAEMLAAERAAFARGVDAAGLMERAGVGIAAAVREFFPEPGHLVVAGGKGHNAGDVLVAARVLGGMGWTWELDLAFPEDALAPLAAAMLGRLRAAPVASRSFARTVVVLDGLLGVGASGAPRSPIREAIQRVGAWQERGAFVVAADGPSGLDADTGEAADPCVTADLTVTIGFAKRGLLADRATNVVGRLAVAPLPGVTVTSADTAVVLTAELLRPLLPRRPFDSHKGTWGRIGIVAGSRGTLGAARLCAEAAVRAGGGLVTLYALPDAYDLLATTAAPEVMVKPVDTYAAALEDRLDAIALGPGLGAPKPGEPELVAEFTGSMVVDADGLNHLAGAIPARFAGPRLFTPHPGEMERLAPGSAARPRREAAEEFVARHGVTLLLKGARTIIAERGAPSAFNTTGNPGMGSGGMGDVLTGVCAAFLGSGHPPREAAMLGAWVCGRAAERAVFAPGGSPESLVARDVIAHLGAAMGELKVKVEVEA